MAKGNTAVMTSDHWARMEAMRGERLEPTVRLAPVSEADVTALLSILSIPALFLLAFAMLCAAEMFGGL